MEIIDKRGPFDITEYKKKISDKFQLVSSTEEDISPSKREAFRFGDLMKGENRVEVCRYFLTALLLSNERKISLENTCCASEGDRMTDDVSVEGDENRMAICNQGELE